MARGASAAGGWGDAGVPPAVSRSIGLATVVVVLGAWYAVTALGLVRPLFLPSPAALVGFIAGEGWTLAAGIGWTTVRMLIGFLIGSAAGITVACLLSWSPSLDAAVEPILQLVRPIPALALTAFAILWFGTGLAGIVVISAWACFIILVIETREAIKNVPSIYLWAGAALGASRATVYRRIILPAVLPGIIGALRVAVVMAFNLTLLMEFRAGVGGIGHLLIRGYNFLRTNALFAAIVCMVVTTLVVDFLLAVALRRLVRWRA